MTLVGDSTSDTVASGAERLLIVHVINGLVADGAEKFLLRLCRNLPQHFHHVISLSDLGPVADGLKASGIPVEALGMRSVAQAPRILSQLTRRLRVLKPDIVQTWMYYSDLIGGIAARRASVPAITWSIRHSDLSWRDYRATVMITAKLCAWLSSSVPDAILANSEDGRAVHQRYGYRSKMFEVIPNGIDLHRYRPDMALRDTLRAEWGIPQGTVVVGAVGRYDAQKGHEFLLEAAKEMLAAGSKVRFVLVGRGVDAANEALAAAIARLDLAPSLLLLGERDDVPALLNGFDVLVSSSIHGEGFPNVVGEAMACGVPCVVTDVGDSAILVGDTGVVVPRRDAAALAEGLLSVARMSPAQRARLGADARERIVNKFGLERAMDRYRDFYALLSASRR